MARWDQTQDGANLSHGWDSIRKLLTRWLPDHLQSLKHLSHRSIRG